MPQSRLSRLLNYRAPPVGRPSTAPQPTERLAGGRLKYADEVPFILEKRSSMYETALRDGPRYAVLRLPKNRARRAQKAQPLCDYSAGPKQFNLAEQCRASLKGKFSRAKRNVSAASKPPVLPCLARFVKAESYDGHSGVNHYFSLAERLRWLSEGPSARRVPESEAFKVHQSRFWRGVDIPYTTGLGPGSFETARDSKPAGSGRFAGTGESAAKVSDRERMRGFRESRGGEFAQKQAAAAAAAERAAAEAEAAQAAKAAAREKREKLMRKAISKKEDGPVTAEELKTKMAMTDDLKKKRRQERAAKRAYEAGGGAKRRAKQMQAGAQARDMSPLVVS